MANRFRRPGLIAVLILAAAAAAAAYYWTTRDEKQAPAYRFARVERGPITATVAASGTLNPVTSVQVGTQVSGQIKELFVDFNSPVRAGPADRPHRPGDLPVPRAQSEADVEAARSALGRAQVSLLNAQRDLDRTRELVSRNFVSPAELDSKQAAFDLARADVKNTSAVIAQREASLASARVDLGERRSRRRSTAW